MILLNHVCYRIKSVTVYVAEWENMKYSESEIDKRIETFSSSKTKNINKAKMYLQIFGVTVAIIVVLTVCFGIAGIVRGLIDSAPDITELDMTPGGYDTVVYDNECKAIQKITSFDANREYVEIDDIPDVVKNAFVAMEDPRFYDHKGIDLQALMRAVYSGITNDNSLTEDSYTITQQLLKNQMFGGGNEKTFFARISRKIQEQCLVIEFENNVDKSQILEYYLNTINLGKNTLGVGAASRWYFDKPVSELNASEASVLAAIGGNPSAYDPVNNQEANSQRRKTVLKKMLDEGYLKEDEYEDALGDDVYTYIKEANDGKNIEENVENSYYFDALIDNVVNDLMEKLGYTETQAYNAIYRSGLKIYTCQDSEIQKICNDVINDDRYYPKDSTKYLSYHLTVENSAGDQKEYSEKDIKSYIANKKGKKANLYYKDESEALSDIENFKKNNVLNSEKIVGENINFIKQPQASFVLIEQATGRVRAIVGGRGDKVDDMNINRATITKRQPGSVLDVLSTYLPAIDTCGATLADVFDDAPYKYPGTSDFIVRGNDLYKGLTTLRDAIVDSSNIVAVKTLEKVSPQTGFDYLTDMGITTLVDKRRDENGKNYTDIRFPIAFGKLTDGVTNLEMTAAYASIANGGKYIKPSFYTKIIDRNGDVLIDNEPETKQVMKESTSWLLTDAMSGIINTESGKNVKFDKIEMSQAGKIGSTDDGADFWFEGFTPYYTAGIWNGYDENKMSHSSFDSLPMWKKIMEKVHKLKGFKDKKNNIPSDIESCSICTKCGNIAIKGLCDKAEDGNDMRTEYFVKGTKPTEYCDCHIRYNENGKSKILLKKDESEYKIKTNDTPYIMMQGSKAASNVCLYTNY